MKTKRAAPELNEFRNFTLPASLTGVLILFVILFVALRHDGLTPSTRTSLISLMLTAIVYTLTVTILLARGNLQREPFNWYNSIFTGLGLCLLGIIMPDDLYFFHNLLVTLATLFISIYSGRRAAALMIFLTIAPHMLLHFSQLTLLVEWGRHFGVLVSAGLILTFVARLEDITLAQIDRLEIINNFSRAVAATRERAEIIALLDKTLPATMSTDSYYLGIREGDQIHVPLFFDDGEYFNDERVKLKGTLSGWVIEHQEGLFLPDLRRKINIEDIEVVMAGKSQVSLSWMGAPLTSARFKGLCALGSYKPHAFHRGDMELLTNLAQHTALALENAAIHAEAQERSRLDSLTGVYNHGYFLELLEQQFARAKKADQPFSVIMLDVDHFKQYNDLHGHLIGDEILTRLCNAIRANIKNGDSVGRWGGEEFIICLPNTTGEQALQIAQRIRQTMSGFVVKASDESRIAAPTISQGIAQFPEEATETFKLIDLADKRLYTAKRRGRDQIEPAG